MKTKNMLLIVGIFLCLLLFVNIMAFSPPSKIKEFDSQNAYIPLELGPVHEGKLAKLNAANITGNDTGCTSVIVHVNPGHDVVSYRRDSNYSADTIIKKINFNGQNAIEEYKLQNGYFGHVIITENGWIISIGGKDDPSTNKQLEKLGSDIILKGNIEKKDLNDANEIIKEKGWGHFVIKSPDDNVGVAIYDSNVSASMIDLFKMNDGDYVKVPNTPRYYSHGNFNKYSNNPINAAIQIIGTDPYGLDRRDVITYELTRDNDSTKVNIWASFDGGALLNRAKGEPDNIWFMDNNPFTDNELKGDEIPKIPDKKFLREEILRDNVQRNNSDVNFYILFLIVFMITITAAILYRKRSI